VAPTQDARAAGERVETLLDELRANGDPKVVAIAEELVGCLVDLYGAGLERVVATVHEDAPAVLDRLVGDRLVESLLLVHDLHPLDVDTRIQRALDRVRPYLGSHAGGVEYRGVDEDGVVHLRLEGSCSGCPSSTVTVRLTIEQAVAEAAPETTGVDVEGVSEPAPAPGPPLLQIGRRAADPDDGWVSVTPPSGAGPHQVTLAGLAVALCRLDDAVYAYRDRCPACDRPVSGGRLAGTVLRCPGCGSRYDIRLAGTGLDRTDLHLGPLPLLPDGAAVRVAVRS
jgi:Fe-S cluster biogenesis protein NfuA